jgi:hypothetical protein
MTPPMGDISAADSAEPTKGRRNRIGFATPGDEAPFNAKRATSSATC